MHHYPRESDLWSDHPWCDSGPYLLVITEQDPVALPTPILHLSIVCRKALAKEEA